MRLFRSVGAVLILRRALRTLESIDRRFAEQNQILLRLANQLAPMPAGPPIAASEVSIDFLNQHEAGAVLAYIDRTVTDTGRAPTEEEILTYLADEATTSLYQERSAKLPPGT